MILESTGDLLKIMSLVVALLAYIGAVRRKLIESKTQKIDMIKNENNQLSKDRKKILNRRISDNLFGIWFLTLSEIPLIFSLLCFVSIVFSDKTKTKELCFFWDVSVKRLETRGFAFFLMGIITFLTLHILEWLTTIEKQKRYEQKILIIMIVICLIFLFL